MCWMQRLLSQEYYVINTAGRLDINNMFKNIIICEEEVHATYLSDSSFISISLISLKKLLYKLLIASYFSSKSCIPLISKSDSFFFIFLESPRQLLNVRPQNNDQSIAFSNSRYSKL